MSSGDIDDRPSCPRCADEGVLHCGWCAACTGNDALGPGGVQCGMSCPDCYTGAQRKVWVERCADRFRSAAGFEEEAAEMTARAIFETMTPHEVVVTDPIEAADDEMSYWDD